MGSPILQTVFAFGMALVVVLIFMEIRGWITGDRLVNRRQKVLRLMSGLFILLILAMILIGDGPARAYHPLAAVGWWFACFSLAVAVVLMAMADLKQVVLRFGEERMQNCEELRDHESPMDADAHR